VTAPTLHRPPIPAPHPVEDDATRRELLKGAGVLTLAGFLAACGGGPDAGARSAGATRTVRDAFGEVQVPADPQRVVVLDRRQTMPHLVSLGVVPLAAGSRETFTGRAFPEVLGPAVADVEPLDPTEPDPERVAALAPDLLIGVDLEIEDTYQVWRRIAPTVAVPQEVFVPEADLRFVAEVVGRADRAQRVIADFDARLEQAETEVGEVGTVTLLSIFADELRFWSSTATTVGRWLHRLGGTMVPQAEQVAGDRSGIGGDLYTAVSLEQLGEASGDTLILLQNPGGEEDRRAREQAQANPLWAQLPAVRAGRVLVLDVQLALGNTGYPGLHAALDDLLPFLRSGG